MKNIYVGNLDFNVSEDELRQAFAAYGQVENVTVLKDRDTGQPRGFGFVEMANDEEAEKAISAMNGYQLGSRALNVNEARPKTGGAVEALAAVAAGWRIWPRWRWRRRVAAAAVAAVERRQSRWRWWRRPQILKFQQRKKTQA